MDHSMFASPSNTGISVLFNAGMADSCITVQKSPCGRTAGPIHNPNEEQSIRLRWHMVQTPDPISWNKNWWVLFFFCPFWLAQKKHVESSPRENHQGRRRPSLDLPFRLVHLKGSSLNLATRVSGACYTMEMMFFLTHVCS
jgi:hypothetical protein